MPPINFDLKHYQQAALDKFRDYLSDVVKHGADVAFYKATNTAYINAPDVVEGTPYVCLRIPTGGGKTIMAAHAVGVAAREYLRTSNPMVLWLVPSDAILTQTVEALKNLDHPYRVVLSKDFGHNVNIMTKAEALAMSRADAEGSACLIVATIQSFRRQTEKGKDNPDGLKVYQDAGALMQHFSGLSEDQKERLDKVDGAKRVTASLANLLRLHRPMVIVDEAHNARTPLSFDTLSRFSPSIILEITATPQRKNNPSRGEYASNILYSSSAAEMKIEEMIKLPIKLTTEQDWQLTVGAALDCQKSLEEAAKAEQTETGEYIRPIILFQAQVARTSDPERITYERLEWFLKEDKRIPAEQIAVHTGNRHDLDNLKIEAMDCPVRFIITVKKLKEGWDCPFAYILCSVEEQRSMTAIEQILGRVLRMPRAKLKHRPALNEAYAFVASANFNQVAQNLKDGLVEGAGFERIEVDMLVTPQGDFNFGEETTEIEYESGSLKNDELTNTDIDTAINKLPSPVASRVRLNSENRSLIHIGPMTKDTRNHLLLAFAKSSDASQEIERLYVKSNNWPLVDSGNGEKSSFIIPMLAFNNQGELELFSEDHFLNMPWPLEKCDADKITEFFQIKDTTKAGALDVDGKGKVFIEFVERVQGDLIAVIQEPAWTPSRLVGWLDNHIQHRDVTKPSASYFISEAIKVLEGKGYLLEEMARYKYELRDALRSYISKLRSERQGESYDALFAIDADKFAISSEHQLIFDEQRYAYNQPYKGATIFNKHYTSIIGDLKSRGEEFECACFIDQMPEIKYWIRNIDRKLNSFWLQLPNGKFYPDFVALLEDGRILVVEYKGEHLYEAEKTKRIIGEVWAEKSNGKCLFCMPTGKNFNIIQQTVAK